MRGFYGGVFWGLVVSGLAVAVLSIVSPLAPPPKLVQDVPGATSDPDPRAVPATGGSSAPDTRVKDGARAVARTRSPVPDSLNGVGAPVAPTTGQPRISGTADQLADPAMPSDLSALRRSSTEDAVAKPRPAAQAPVAPVPGHALQHPVRPAMEPTPAQTVAPKPLTTAQGPQRIDLPAMQPEPAPAVAVSGGGPSLVGPDADPAPRASTVSAPVPFLAPDGAPVPDIAEQLAGERPGEPQPVRGDAAVEIAPIQTQKPPAAAPPDQNPVSDPEPDAGQRDARAPLVPSIAPLPQAGIDTDGPRAILGKRVLPLTERAPANPVSNGAPSGIPPLQEFATLFEAPAEKPLMAIVLIDDTGSVDPAVLAAFPYPLSIAVDPATPDAADIMARHRAAGFEILSLVDLPAGATAQDVEITLSAGFDTLTQAVGVLEGPGSGLQGNRHLSGQVADFIRSTGRGMVMQAGGLNAAYKLARRTHVPAALVFRDLDADAPPPEVMRRYLDQGALRAGQQGWVVMLGRLRPDTLRVLAQWGVQDGGTRVALAPISAVLQRSVTQD
ncbi:divergent polysaccharide deacetylase family protein [Rhodobacteraceae bacterium F11138]|nr:divergent polysaccharide deacetylase family protein [Rhodobacteraceae bacterium F11138]